MHLNLIQMIWIGSEGWEGPKMFGFIGGAPEYDEKIGEAWLKDVIQTHLNLIQMGLNQDLVLEVSKKCSDLWWSFGIWWKNIGQSWRTRIKITKALG